jgi:hypothetical protein
LRFPTSWDSVLGTGTWSRGHHRLIIRMQRLTRYL